MVTFLLSEANPMLSLIAAQTIVSSGTLRPDHLCEALIGEADRLGIVLDRDLWQPAAAIAAHGHKPGSAFCLDLPTRLMEISSEIVSELFDALNWAAPSGCSLGESDGDGSLFLWTLTLEAQAEAINSEPNGRWEAKTLDVPEHWLSAIVNGDESSFDYHDDKQDYKHYEQFVADELSDGWTVSSYEEEGDFRAYHDASPYGVLPCDAVKVLAMRQKSQA
jgi:hypothetical protein